jgi:hypothetical protein
VEPGGGAPFLGIQNDMGRRAQGMESLSMGAPMGNLAVGLSTGNLRRLWRQAPFPTGALLRIMWGLFTGNSERQ